MNERDELFGAVGRHTLPEGLKRRIMDEIALTPQEGVKAPPLKKRRPVAQWLGWAALPVAASVALWLAAPGGGEKNLPTTSPTAQTALVEELSDETLLAALDEIYGVESVSTGRNGYDNDTTLQTIYGIDHGEQKKETNDA